MILYIFSVRRALRSSCSGFGRPRSAKILPLLACVRAFALVRIIVPRSLVIALCLGKSSPYQAQIYPWRRDALFRFLLKDVQVINRMRKMGGGDSAESLRSVPLDELHDPHSAKTLQGFGRRVR